MVNLLPTRPQDSVIPSEGGAAAAIEGSAVSSFKRRLERGFTLIELMIVMVIIGLLAAIAVPMYVQSVRHAKEAVLKEDLRTLRSAIEPTPSISRRPQTLDDLVQAGYLKSRLGTCYQPY
jgi:prepilin-type N-terminal cleavage/methylation domain-containing protein